MTDEPGMPADAGGGLVHARRGAPWGRDPRVFGYAVAVFFPSAAGFCPARFRFGSTGFFVAEAPVSGALLGPRAVGVAERARVA